MRIRALIAAAAFAIGLLGVWQAPAQEVTVCYDVHIVLDGQDQVNEADCIVLPPG